MLRAALGRSLATGTPFTIEHIRGGRREPDLLRQHLTAIEAAARVGAAEVVGVAIGSQALVFRPERVQPGHYTFAVGTAGSATLVLQTVLPALVTRSEERRVGQEGRPGWVRRR